MSGAQISPVKVVKAVEGLNVKKVGEYYYLFVAEGGTAGPPTSHMVVLARSKNIMGPWENAPSFKCNHPSSFWTSSRKRV